jgi:hypothetical protein
VQGRKLLVGLFTLGLLMIAVYTASAQDVITLGATGSNTTNFGGTESGNGTLSLTSDPLKAMTLGRDDFNSGPALFSLTEAADSLGSGDLTEVNTGSIVQSAQPTFSSGLGGSLLEGNLELLSLTGTGKTGLFDTTLVLDLANLSGSSASLFTPPVAAAQLGVVGAGRQMRAALSTRDFCPVALRFMDHHHQPHRPLPYHPSCCPYHAPEPTSMLLLGSGLLVLGTLVRRHRRQAQCSEAQPTRPIGQKG